MGRTSWNVYARECVSFGMVWHEGWKNRLMLGQDTPRLIDRCLCERNQLFFGPSDIRPRRSSVAIPSSNLGPPHSILPGTTWFSLQLSNRRLTSPIYHLAKLKPSSMDVSCVANCITCRARGEQCDGIKAPTGCQRCTQTRIQCEGYQTKVTVSEAKAYAPAGGNYSNTPFQVTFNSFDPNNTAASTTTPSNPSQFMDIPQPGGTNHAAPIELPSPYSIHNPQRRMQLPLQPSGSQTLIPIQVQSAHEPGIGYTHTSFPIVERASPEQPSTSPVNMYVSRTDDNSRTYASGLTILNSSNPIGVSTLPVAPHGADDHVPNKLGIAQWGMTQRPKMKPLWSDSVGSWEGDLEVDCSESSELRVLRKELTKALAPDRKVKSNMLPFLIESFTSWTKFFVFEPARVINVIRHSILRNSQAGEADQERMLLVAGAVRAVSRSTNYDLTDFLRLHTHVVGDVRTARKALERDDLTKEMAINVMSGFHDVRDPFSIIGVPFINIPVARDMFAPIFRRACPESNKELANLPSILSAPQDIHLKYFATLDTIQSAITSRPMFFRYNLDFISAEVEQSIDSDDGPGLRWALGIPDRLCVVLAKLNTIYEDGQQPDPEQVQALEAEIQRCSPIIPSTSVMDPVLMLGRIVVQEAWRHAAQIYLYMASHSFRALLPTRLADRMTTGFVQGRFQCRAWEESRFVLGSSAFYGETVDSVCFLYADLRGLKLGVAASKPHDRSDISTRLWGVAECKKQGTMGNDIVRVLTDIWARTTDRPVVWADIRTSFLRVIGI
ncbi:fungal zn(2)-Cys(6) binuclear cluster domain-containing protein [Rhizoctonia solani AG-1 IA]|uniref:Fungal zn(2)-Cys(6) binuclear cluster domain-containing protein n=1 Tax=Thanatephorus cucumeris (strain AG1-IA) TaxID=983506 RepID=L8WNM8_THACA|nr:fungal zn(2)-Cys(6) binuclear cluster domain-containing protein [Rhizoctonia solani AG-1 IA]